MHARTDDLTGGVSTHALRQWDAVENKTSVAIYGGGALVFLWLSSTIVGAVNAVPLVRHAAIDNRCPASHL